MAGKRNGGSITNYGQKSRNWYVRKKLDSWNEVIEKANKDFYANRKEFWAFVGSTSKGSRKGIASLGSTLGSCVTSTKGKLEVLREHYERLGTASVDDQFDDKTGGNDGLVGELFKYGGKGMANLLEVLYGVVWTEESIPKQWRQGLIVRLYKKEDPGNYRGITLLNVVGKVFSKILNNRLVSRLEAERALHEGQAGFREKRSCVDNIFTLKIVQGRMREGKHTYACFLDVRKAFDTVWHHGLWYKLWELWVWGRMWRVINRVLFYWREKYLSHSI